ncbi:AfsR/SARP family transcriptional regulator [Streptomyces sp. CMB-StM0423]|uniref:AfsR/SARP family transcriptional regulator n=1 Tax=Streptomyces sp. CMB-StM0423 TaxID=2059884 RepID=UPI000C70AE90|nr:BTAD domain-containing putative transcriptional regulator [Streptomyces sp. CMB-StM0423]AUH45111.1 SARP family transcriptional regulator [Streptomyces sp. CMB-StM0423]
MRVLFGVLGPVTAWDGDGAGSSGDGAGGAADSAIALKGPRHRAVLARLIVARRRVVPVGLLAEDLWTDPPADAVGTVRTFVAALRRALEPGRPPRAPARLLVTQGPGYALRAEPDSVDAWRFEAAVGEAGALPPGEAVARLDQALGWWRGPAYAEFADLPWARTERSRLADLRLHAVELHAEARLSLGRAAETAADLDAHVAGHPWREDAWRLLALALYRAGRQADALAVLRRARTMLGEQLGVDPGPALRRLETDILAQADHLEGPGGGREVGAGGGPGGRSAGAGGEGVEPEGRRQGIGGVPDGGGPAGAAEAPAPGVGGGGTDDRGGSGPDSRVFGERAGAGRDGGDAGGGEGEGVRRVWAEAAAAYDRAVAGGARARLESTVGLLRSLAVTGGGGLQAARRHRVAAVEAAEESGDPELTARVIGAYDVPAVWTRVDDPEQAARVVAAAERALAALPPAEHAAVRARLLATVAVESRGTRSARGPQAAREAERLARGLDDPALLAFALNGVFMQTFERTGLAAERDGIGAELVALSARHGLVTYEVLGHLIRLQARAALADFPGADEHAAAADRLAERHELPLVAVFTGWYAALRLAETGTPPPHAAAPAGAGPAGRDVAGRSEGADASPVQAEAATEAGTRPSPPYAPSDAEDAYRAAARLLDGAGMPGLERGLLPLALLCLRLRRGLPVSAGGGADWGPYEPWVRPLLLLGERRRAEAATALRAIAEPPRDLMQEAVWCLVARAAVELGDRETVARARDRLAPAADEIAGAGTGLLTLGPVADHLAALTAALGDSPPA